MTDEIKKRAIEAGWMEATIKLIDDNIKDYATCELALDSLTDITENNSKRGGKNCIQN